MNRTLAPLAISLAAAVVFSTGLHAAKKAPMKNHTRYEITFPDAKSHYLNVEATYPHSSGELDLMMAVWSPGSYLVREYARNVEEIRAYDSAGKPLAIEKTRKNRWRIAPARGPVRVTYRLYARELRVQSNFVDSDFALIHGPATFIAPLQQLDAPFEVAVLLPNNWQKSLSGMKNPSSANTYQAANFDELLDSPIVAGNPAIYEFAVGGKPHFLVNLGGESFWDGARAARDAQKIVEANVRVWGSVPYDRYFFFNFIVDAGGGLEHHNSTVLMTRRYQMRTRKTYLSWLELVAHEHFHAWNVKRLRPAELGPFDYENEVYSPNLWVAEGITEYYDELQVHRAGLSTREEYFEALSKEIETLQTTPGRLQQSMELASFDSWIKLYRPDENSANTAISYYTKGAVIGFLLDTKIRAATNEKKTLEDVMRAAYVRYSGARGFTADEFKALVGEVATEEVATWLDRIVSKPEELDYDEAMQFLGLEFKKEEKKEGEEVRAEQQDRGEQDAATTLVREPRKDKEPKGWLGAITRNDAGRLIVAQLRRDTPAFEAGMNVDDEIIAVDHFRVPADQLDARLEQYRPGEKVILTIARRGKLREINVTLGKEPPKVWKIQVAKEATEEQKRRIAAWLG